MLEKLLMDQLMTKLRQTNPNAYNEFVMLQKSGKTPDAVIEELMRTGRFSEADVKKAIDQATGLGNSGNIGTSKF